MNTTNTAAFRQFVDFFAIIMRQKKNLEFSYCELVTLLSCAVYYTQSFLHNNLIVLAFSRECIHIYLTPICLSSSRFHLQYSATEVSQWSYAKCLRHFKESATQGQIINNSCACSSKFNDGLDFVAFCYVRPSTRIFCIIKQKIHVVKSDF